MPGGDASKGLVMPAGLPEAGAPVRSTSMRRSRRRAVRASSLAVWCWGCLSFAAALLCLTLAAYHPLSGIAAVAACVVLAIAVAWRPGLGFAVLPALLPLIGLMPWTGWLTVEEFDLAVLAVAAGGYMGVATGRQASATAAAQVRGRSGAAGVKGLLVLA